MDAAELDLALKSAGIPIEGCAVPSDNKADWRVDFASSATDAHKTAAADVIAAYVPQTPAQKADASASREVSRKELKAVALALWECIPAPAMNKAQMQNRVLSIYKTL